LISIYIIDNIDGIIQNIMKLSKQVTVERKEHTLVIRNIRKARSLNFLMDYFSNEELSGGGKLSSEPLLENGGKTATVSFMENKGAFEQ